MATVVNNIPSKYEPGFKKMISLEESTFEEIVKGLLIVPLTHSISTLSSAIAGLQNLDSETVNDILSTAGSLIPFIEKKVDPNELVNSITTIAEKNELLSPENTDQFKRRLHFLLTSEKIYYASKSSHLLSEYGNIFLEAKLATDLRPVFGLEVEQEPKTALIVHHLHIHYQDDEEGDHKDIYLALDLADIRMLKELLDRAEKKENSLRSLCAKAGIAPLNIQ